MAENSSEAPLRRAEGSIVFPNFSDPITNSIERCVWRPRSRLVSMWIV